MKQCSFLSLTSSSCTCCRKTNYSAEVWFLRRAEFPCRFCSGPNDQFFPQHTKILTFAVSNMYIIPGYSLLWPVCFSWCYLYLISTGFVIPKACFIPLSFLARRTRSQGFICELGGQCLLFILRCKINKFLEKKVEDLRAKTRFVDSFPGDLRSRLLTQRCMLCMLFKSLPS